MISARINSRLAVPFFLLLFMRSSIPPLFRQQSNSHKRVSHVFCAGLSFASTSRSSISNESAISINLVCRQNTVSPVLKKSMTTLIAKAIPMASVGNPSCLIITEKQTTAPPAIGTAAMLLFTAYLCGS